MPHRFHFAMLFAVLSVAARGVPERHRLVSASPELTEILFQLGKGKDIVATSALSEFPAEAKALPEIGPLFMPSIERTMRLAPDWVLLDEQNLSPAYERALEASRIPALKVRLTSLDALVREATRLLAVVYGERSSATIEAAKRCLATLPPTGGRREFLALVWLSPPVLAGHATFLSDLLTRVAGTNAAPSAWATPYPQVSEEWLLRHPVDTVYYLSETESDEKTAERITRGWWPNREVRRVRLESRHFARASFTPLAHLDALGLAAGSHGKECLELAR